MLTEETAIVAHVSNGYAYLNVQNKQSCKSCSSQNGCSSFAFFDLKISSELKVPNQLGVKAGDTVVVALGSDKLLWATFLVYLFPLLMLLLSALLANHFIGELASIVFGIGGFLFSLIGVKKFIKLDSIGKGFEPVMVTKVVPIQPILS